MSRSGTQARQGGASSFGSDGWLDLIHKQDLQLNHGLAGEPYKKEVGEEGAGEL